MSDSRVILEGEIRCWSLLVAIGLIQSMITVRIGSKDSCYQLIKAMTKFKKQKIPW